MFIIKNSLWHKLQTQVRHRPCREISQSNFSPTQYSEFAVFRFCDVRNNNLSLSLFGRFADYFDLQSLDFSLIYKKAEDSEERAQALARK